LRPSNNDNKLRLHLKPETREKNMASEVMSDATQRQELADELAKYGVRVAQPDDPPLFTREPKSSMQPFHWKAADLARLLEKIGAALKLEQGGQRRTLRLTNPGLPYGTTPTFWASIQYMPPAKSRARIAMRRPRYGSLWKAAAPIPSSTASNTSSTRAISF